MIRPLTIFSFLALTNLTLCQVVSSYFMGDSLISFESKNRESSSKILFINLHENEATSIEALNHFDHEGNYPFVRLIHGGTRRIFFNFEDRVISVDPNRIYSRDGIQATLLVDSVQSHKAERIVRLLAREVLTYLRGFDWIISLHNNTPENYSVNSYLPGGEEGQNAAGTFISDRLDPDDFIFTTSEKLFSSIAAKGAANCVLQDNRHCQDDGSLSVYCGRHGIDYANVEAEEGHLEQQIELIKILISAIPD